MIPQRRSNCHLTAWRHYRQGNAVRFCFKPTLWSRSEKIIKHPLALPIRLLGIALQWICWPLTHIGEYLRSGRWYHVTWMDKEGRHWEFVRTNKHPHFLPPIIFKGTIKQIEE